MPPHKANVPNLNAPSQRLISQLSDVVGVQHAITDVGLQGPYLREWRDRFVGRTPLVLRPNTTRQVSKILALAHDARVGIVPQSGNTGLVGGQIPQEDGSQIVVSLECLNSFRSIDASKLHMTVEAGVTLAQARDKAESVGRLFPLSMASQGSCQIGGNLATNAGGLNVLAYGPARNLVAGLEVVLADGTVWDGLKALKKDNTGYDLRDLFVGSEGTLGVITAAVLKLFPRPSETTTAFVALDDLGGVLKLFEFVMDCSPSTVTAFEFMPAIALDFVVAHCDGVREPFTPRHPWYVLLEVSDYGGALSARRRLEEQISGALRDGYVKDAVIAGSLKQSAELWRLREGISEAQKPEGGSIKHDVSVPVEKIFRFIELGAKVVEQVCPGARPVPFGHFGDGNIHYNISQPIGMDRDVFLEKWETMSDAIHDLVCELGGSISAEHGIGRMKRDALKRYKSDVELEMMRGIKASLDPRGILNPGKVL